MNMKYNWMSSEKTNLFISKLRYKLACFYGYCPTLKEMQNEEIKKIARSLKGNSDKETLTNVLAWQDRLISYWYERWNWLILILILSAVGYLGYLLALLFLSSFGLVLSLGFFGGAPVVFLVSIALVKNRKLPIWSGFVNCYAFSISIDFLLERKLAVCRDYAKLTACLLSSIYPDREIYFATAFQHVATGITVDDRKYVLDKWLPVVTIEKWHERWKTKKLEKMKGGCLELEPVNFGKYPEPDIQKLTIEMRKLLDLNKQEDESSGLPLEVYRWKKGWLLYEDNDIVNYSLSRLIKNKIHDQMIDLDQITKLEAIPDKDDLIFRIEFTPNTQ